MARSLPTDYFIRDGFMVRRPRQMYEAEFSGFTAKSTDLTGLMEFRDQVEQTSDIRLTLIREISP